MNFFVLVPAVDPQHHETVSGGLGVLLLLLFTGQRHHQRAVPQPARSRLRARACLCAHTQQQTDPADLPVSAAQPTGESPTVRLVTRHYVSLVAYCHVCPHLCILLRSTCAVGIAPWAAQTSPSRLCRMSPWTWRARRQRWRGHSCSGLPNKSNRHCRLRPPTCSPP